MVFPFHWHKDHERKHNTNNLWLTGLQAFCSITTTHQLPSVLCMCMCARGGCNLQYVKWKWRGSRSDVGFRILPRVSIQGDEGACTETARSSVRVCVNACVYVCRGTTEHWLQCEVAIVRCLSCHVSDLISWILTSPRLNPPDVSDGAPHLCFHGNAIIPHANWALIRAAIMGWRGGMRVRACVRASFWRVMRVRITVHCRRAWISILKIFPSFFLSSSAHPALRLPAHLHRQADVHSVRGVIRRHAHPHHLAQGRAGDRVGDVRGHHRD